MTDDELVEKMAFAYDGGTGRPVSIAGLEAAIAIVRPIIEREALEKALRIVNKAPVIVCDDVIDYARGVRYIAAAIRALIPEQSK